MDTCRIKFILILVILFSIFFGLECKNKQLEEIFDNILLTYSKIKFYEADFQQENFWIDLNVTKKSKGKLYFDVDHFLMQYDEPAGQLLLLEGKSITIYDPNMNQAMISNEIETELRPDKLISDYWQKSQKNLIFCEGNLIKIKLTTPSKDQFTILLKDYLVIEILILDPDQNFVLYKFSNSRINQELPENVFDLNLPEDATILDTR
jgi:outer membrane lipoprotein-sorting protein